MIDSDSYSSVDQSAADQEQRNLTMKFVVTGFVVAGLLSVLISLSGYYLSRLYNLHVSAQLTATKINETLAPQLSNTVFEQPEEALSRLGDAFRTVTGAKAVAFIDLNGQLLWSSDTQALLRLDELEAPLLSFIPLSLFQTKDNLTIDQRFLTSDAWLSLLTNSYPLLTQHITVFDSNGTKIGGARLAMNVSYSLMSALLLAGDRKSVV